MPCDHEISKKLIDFNTSILVAHELILIQKIFGVIRFVLLEKITFGPFWWIPIDLIQVKFHKESRVMLAPVHLCLYILPIRNVLFTLVVVDDDLFSFL